MIATLDGHTLIGHTVHKVVAEETGWGMLDVYKWSEMVYNQSRHQGSVTVKQSQHHYMNVTNTLVTTIGMQETGV